MLLKLKAHREVRSGVAAEVKEERFKMGITERTIAYNFEPAVILLQQFLYIRSCQNAAFCYIMELIKMRCSAISGTLSKIHLSVISRA